MNEYILLCPECGSYAHHDDVEIIKTIDGRREVPDEQIYGLECCGVNIDDCEELHIIDELQRLKELVEEACNTAMNGFGCLAPRDLRDAHQELIKAVRRKI